MPDLDRFDWLFPEVDSQPCYDAGHAAARIDSVGLEWVKL